MNEFSAIVHVSTGFGRGRPDIDRKYLWCLYVCVDMDKG